MYNTAEEWLQSATVRQIMNDYFTNAAALLCCRPSREQREWSEKMLDLTLEIFGEADCREACRQILEETNAMRTAMDGLLLNLEEFSVSDLMRCYFDMKAAALRQPELPQPLTLDVQLLPDMVRRSGVNGLAWALRLGACLNWLQVDARSSRENALHIWRMLACAGDLFAMRGLEYGLRYLGDNHQSEMWKQTRRLCEEADSRFLAAIPAKMREDVSREAGDMAQLIVSLGGTVREKNGILPLSMLQYAAESRDSLQQKLHNLCGGRALFQLRLIEEKDTSGKQYGF